MRVQNMDVRYVCAPGRVLSMPVSGLFLGAGPGGEREGAGARWAEGQT